MGKGKKLGIVELFSSQAVRQLGILMLLMVGAGEAGEI
jgi:hypothetical protein